CSWRIGGGGGPFIYMDWSIGGGWFSKRSIDANNGSGGGSVLLGGKSSKESKYSLDGEVVCGTSGVLGGDSRGVVGGATL
ncbi:hypothetical protein Tco_1579810, partial [Tanacetum coccineum]